MAVNLWQIEYKGWKNCLRLSNGTVELVITLDIGPRIISYGFTGGQNFLKEFDEQLGETGGDEWKSYGGHRLWHAPEVYPRTYYPDNESVEHSWDGEKLILVSPVEETNGLQKKIEISLDENSSSVTLKHYLYNRSNWDIEVSAWCLSVMAAGGRAVVPQESYIPHGEGAGETFLPARKIVLWPFTFMGDPRYKWGTKYIQMIQDDSHESKQKIGLSNTLGWAAYALNEELFIKKFDHIEGAEYPDMGCNCELFTMPGFLEVETLSPLTQIKPGEKIEHNEKWELHKVNLPENEDEIDRAIKKII